VENKDVSILVIDDEPTMADSLKQNLMEEGYSVDIAATGGGVSTLLTQTIGSFEWQLLFLLARPMLAFVLVLATLRHD